MRVLVHASAYLDLILNELPHVECRYENIGFDIITFHTALGDFFLTTEEADALIEAIREKACDDCSCFVTTLADAVERLLRGGEVPRWRAKIKWHFDDGSVDDDVYMVDEVEELHEIIEAGPGWDEIKKINIELEYQL